MKIKYKKLINTNLYYLVQQIKYLLNINKQNINTKIVLNNIKNLLLFSNKLILLNNYKLALFKLEEAKELLEVLNLEENNTLNIRNKISEDLKDLHNKIKNKVFECII